MRLTMIIIITTIRSLSTVCKDLELKHPPSRYVCSSLWHNYSNVGQSLVSIFSCVCKSCCLWTVYTLKVCAGDKQSNQEGRVSACPEPQRVPVLMQLHGLVRLGCERAVRCALSLFAVHFPEHSPTPCSSDDTYDALCTPTMQHLVTPWSSEWFLASILPFSH